jgi:predicted ATP-binding protein involved in virulence/nucleoside phosphorylase
MEDALMVQQPQSNIPCAVILTALPVEYLAVRSHLHDLQAVTIPGGKKCEKGTFTFNLQGCDVIISEIGSGNSNAAIETERAIEYFKPDLILFVGIAVKIRYVALGDVVAATRIYEYESAIAKTDPHRIVHSSSLLQKRASNEEETGEWVKRLPAINSSTPRVFVAPMLSGDRIKSLQEPLSFSGAFGEAVAGEMEGLGFLSSTPNLEAMVIRGIAYSIGSTGNIDRNHEEIAARNASAFAFEMLAKFKFKSALNLPIVKVLTSKKKKIKNFIVSRVELSNIRCFERLTVDFDETEQSDRWTMILGDNAIGKSTLLKSIALGLCNESDAVALIKEMSGEFVRKGAEEGYIKIHLRENKEVKWPKKYTIVTKITRKFEDASEIVRQKTTPAENFPWADIFVCGYGTNRSAQAYNSYEQYKVIDAVKSLFDPQAFLQNPEVVLLRQDPSVRSILEEKLQSILMLDTPEYKIHYTKRGLELDGSWGRMPVQVLSDGYRSTTQWVLDFIGWLIISERLIGNPDIGGILIIDEIEQHLHPRWQRYIVQRLRQQFPKTQIIASTHTPLVAAGIADVDRSMLLKLDRNEDSEITVQIIDKELIAGKRADQVLTSEAFGLVTTRNNRSHDDVDRYTELLGKQNRTDAEAAELEELRSIVQNRLSGGETATSQIVEKAVDEALQGIITNVSPEILDVETKKQLRALFQSES